MVRSSYLRPGLRISSVAFCGDKCSLLNDHPPAVTVYVEPLVAHKAQHRHAKALRRLNGKAARGTYSRQHPNPGGGRLLHQLEADPAADQQNVLMQWQPPGQQRRANYFVQGIVAAHVFAQQQQLALRREQGRGVLPAGLLEAGLGGAQLRRAAGAPRRRAGAGRWWAARGRRRYGRHRYWFCRTRRSWSWCRNAAPWLQNRL